MKDRIRQLMESQHLSQQSFADVLNISPASLSSIFNDRTKPTLNHVDAIKKKFPNISLDWLMFGKEPMFIDAASEQPGTPGGGSVPSHSSSSASPASGSEPMLAFDLPATPQQLSANRDQNLRGHLGQKTVDYPEVKYIDKPQRRISEIRIFYDDQTWETFVPKK